VFGEADLRRVLKSYASYYNRACTHLSLRKGGPLFRRQQTVGNIVSIPILGGSIINMFESRSSVRATHLWGVVSSLDRSSVGEQQITIAECTFFHCNVGCVADFVRSFGRW
jgi:hypothetical protein